MIDRRAALDGLSTALTRVGRECARRVRDLRRGYRPASNSGPETQPTRSRYVGAATLIQTSGETAVDCKYEITIDHPRGSDDRTSWRGTYATTTDASPTLGPASLRRADGMTGDVTITSVAYTRDIRTVTGEFTGTAKPPAQLGSP